MRGCCLEPGAPPASLGAFPIFSEVVSRSAVGHWGSGVQAPQTWISGCLRVSVSVCVTTLAKSPVLSEKARGLCSSVSVGPSHLNASDFLLPYHFLFLCSVHRSPWWELRSRQAKRGRRGESPGEAEGVAGRGPAELALHPVLEGLQEGRGDQGDPRSDGPLC